MDELSIGTEIGRFQILKELNRGAFARIYLASDSKSMKLYAIKCLCKVGLNPNLSSLQKLELHWNCLLGLHENIVHLEDCIETRDYLFLVFEYVSGGDICDLLTNRNLTDDEIITIFGQVLNGVKHCHDKGIYHRDIKPENVMVSSSYVAKLLDFGLSTDRSLCVEYGVGTKTYMAPEVFDESSTDPYYAKFADMWSLGCLLLTMSCRNPLWEEPCSEDLSFVNFMKDRRRALENYNFSSQIILILLKLLDFEPENRGNIDDLVSLFSKVHYIFNPTELENSSHVSNSLSRLSCFSEESAAQLSVLVDFQSNGNGVDSSPFDLNVFDSSYYFLHGYKGPYDSMTIPEEVILKNPVFEFDMKSPLLL